MLKIGVIGLGDIAGKAYLPVLSGISDVEVHLCTRNRERLEELGSRYRFEHLHESLDSLMESGIRGAFVHSSTASHEEIVRELLLHNIHVFVDKPMTFHAESARGLYELAKSRHLVLMVGFNRRYAPSYQRLKEIEDPNMVVIQKNRASLPGDIRTFVFDDFIHVADSLLYLFPYPVDRWTVTGRKKGDLLHHVVVQGMSEFGTAIGIMNRDSGTTEEKAEVMSPKEKGVVLNVADVVIRQGREEWKPATNDWEPTLHKRGFEEMVADFLQAVESGSETELLFSSEDSLRTHELCEEVVQQLEKE
ncbi:Gfo/Idh/MocA family protein [Salipaludibacillus daqingensis]|uniref:Gfo/Idh/MocA family protein n=1 Tax=Salipaludibacillus daqingensis TaxID=3041001 RepID=UPI0024753652|nr:Gfo/Idh/MocA family oxidoreductase [Salipaludibacillus daqingensis]